MAGKIGGFFNRMIVGSEKSEDYARKSLPSNRWELFWDILKGSFWKLVGVNLITAIFALPLIMLLLFRNMSLISFGATCPYSQSFGAGYMAATSLVGYAETASMQFNFTVMLLLPAACAIFSIGISGCAYVIRNMVWTEGVFVSNDFWRGIKQNIGQILSLTLIYSVICYLCLIVTSYNERLLAMGEGVSWLLVVSNVFTFVVLAFVTVMFLHSVTMSVTYKLKFTQLIKNSFIFTVALLPSNILFILLASIPLVLIFIGSIFTLIGYALILLFDISYFLLVWTDYSQWAYDKFINDKIPGAKKNRGIYEKVKDNSAESLKKYRDSVVAAERSMLNARPVKPITDDELKLAELPSMYSRADIERLNESRQVLYEDNERYIKEHENDPEFADLAHEPTKDETKTVKKVEKAKKELEKRNKKRK